MGQGREDQKNATRHHHRVHQVGVVCVVWYWVFLLHHHGVDYMSELEKASLRVFAIIMIGLGIILWLQLQGCAPPPPQPIEYESVPMDSTLA